MDLNNEVYLDNAATTRCNEKVAEEIKRILNEEYGNPSSLHKRGRDADKILKGARLNLGLSIGASGDEIFFNSCATEGNNQILRNFKGKHIITTEIEHPSILNTLKELIKEGTEVTFLKVDNEGRIKLEEFRSSLRKDTALVSIMMVNNEIGTINPIEEIGKIIKNTDTKAKFHSDLVQGYLKYPIDVKKMGLDFATVSLHKVHGPKGIGILYLRKSLKLNTFIAGGGQEDGMRAGTHNVPYIGGISLIPSIYQGKMKSNEERISGYKMRLYEELKDIPGFKLNGSLKDSSAYILNVSFSKVRAQVLMNLLEEKNVWVSTGSACSQKNLKDSHVLKAIGTDKDHIQGSLRLSFSDDIEEKDIDNAIESFKHAFRFLGRIN